MIIRVKHEKNYLVVSRETVRDQNLSFEARGMLVYFLSFDSEWKFYASEICSRNKISRTKFRRMLKELIANGYCKRDKVRNEKGRFIYDYTVSEKSTGQNPPVVDSPVVDPPVVTDPVSISNQSISNQRSINESSSDSKTTNSSRKINLKDFLWNELSDKQKAFVSDFKVMMTRNGIPYEPEKKDLQAIKTVEDGELLASMSKYMVGWARFVRNTDDNFIRNSDASIAVFKRSFNKFRNYFDEMYTFEEFEEPVVRS